ncbi:unnamed protein product [Ectocarpus sp. 4 AP-2014]|uniref:EsV-1-154 n=1 Tax=Ectocarpus siliculosus virus 1 (isolate New Zealand/Kaikoura/1988) TaxID=654926 RepID=Q8QNC8_ESV1K|nr:EsV-1-154 [Ectocarpus siliculosus virus 1]AAK14569.1 EsV-1-154 [Ectocarpus siliculosus virus 1]
MATSSPLFKRIMACSNAIRHHKNEKIGNVRHSSHDEVSSYDEVVKFIHGNTPVSELPRTKDVTRAALEYMKRGWHSPDDAKAKFALYLAILVAYDNAENGLAKEVCDRFRCVYDFDRHAMEQIFKISLCNDRVRKVLDNLLISKTEGTLVFEHVFNMEFVEIFFNGMEMVVRDMHTLADLGYTSNVTSTDMKLAREIMDNHLGEIATRCSPCFQRNVLRLPRKNNNLFPAGDGFPQVSIGCDPVRFGGVTEDKLENAKNTIDLLKESLMDKDEKGEFLEMMFAAISHASNPRDPVVTYRRLQLESVKHFFLEKMLDKAQAEETRKAILASHEARELYQQNKSLEEKNSGLEKDISKLKEDLSCSREEFELLKKRLLESGDICRKFAKQIPALKEKSNELERENKRIKISLAMTQKNETALRQDRESLTRKKMTRKQEADMIWEKFNAGHGSQDQWSGDEMDE